MIKLVDIFQHYGIRPVLKNINMEIKEGELVVVMGPNGMGKTTLLMVMAGVLWPQKGYSEIDGKKRRSSEEAELAIRQQVCFLPADPWLPDFMTGREYLLSVGRIYDIEDERLMDHIDRVTTLFNLYDKQDSTIGMYSTGQRKKISLASALVTEAKILLLDEPFSGGLDPSGIVALKKVLHKLADRKDVTIVMTTPVPELVEELAHRIAVIKDGELAAFDTADGLRKITNCEGSLEDVMERLMEPGTYENIKNYFKE